MDNQFTYIYDDVKNHTLKVDRGVCFEDVIRWIEEDKVIAVLSHPNHEKYPNQKIYVIEHNGYAYNVPFVRDHQTIFLKTVFPSRKATKAYLK